MLELRRERNLQLQPCANMLEVDELCSIRIEQDKLRYLLLPIRIGSGVRKLRQLGGHRRQLLAGLDADPTQILPSWEQCLLKHWTITELPKA